MTSKALSKRAEDEQTYSVHVFPNVSRSLMGSGNPYIHHLKEAISLYALNADPAISNQAFPDLLRRGLRSDMIIFNWLENLPSRRMGMLQAMVILAYLPLLKARGVRLVWIKHNKISHTKRWFGVSKTIQRWLIRYADHIIAHSSDIDLPDTRKLHYLPHPCNIAPGDVLRPAVANDHDHEPEIDLLIWGSLFPYKGVLEFLQFASKDAALSQLKIHVAGKSDPAYWEQLKKHAGSNVTLVNRFIPEEEVVRLFQRTRFILFTYNKKSVMSSGVLPDSLAACRKIIAPDCGAFSDMAREYPFVHLYNDFSEIAAVCRDHYGDYALNYEQVCTYVAENSWQHMGKKIKELTGLNEKKHI